MVSLFDKMNIKLKPYSPDNFANLKDIIDTNRDNKKALIFLLENDTYSTDEVYGDYYIEKKGKQYEISYFRRKEKRQTLPNRPLTINLNEEIKKDVILQIQNQFDYMWQILSEEIERCQNNFKYKLNNESNILSSLLIKFLSTPECVYLDFKSKMYKIQTSDKKLELIQRKEFIKDVLGLINNKTIENNTGKAYIIIGVEEKKGKYNGKHNNIEFDNFQLLNQLINEYITPHLDINQIEFYLSGKSDELNLSLERINDYDRCLLLMLFYQKGTVYELKRKIGNPSMGIPFYYKGTSFTRDGSHTRRITQEDRERILNMRNQFINNTDNRDDEEFFEEYESPKINKERRTVNVELIDNYIKILKSRKRSNENVLKILDSIRDEFRKFDYFDLINKEEAVAVFNRFITFASTFFREYDVKVMRTVLNMLRNFVENENNDFISTIKKEFYDKLEILYLNGNRFSSLIHVLNYCGYFDNLYETILQAIIEKDFELLKTIQNFKLNFFKKIDRKWEKIQELLDQNENLDLTIHIDKNISDSIDRIIKILEKKEI